MAKIEYKFIGYAYLCFTLYLSLNSKDFNVKIIPILSLISLFFIACTEEQKNPKNISITEKKVETKEVNYTKKQIKELKTASKVVYNLPSPAEMAKILFETQAIYDASVLNNPKAVQGYYTDVSRAMNLGVYFADLSFTSMYDYPQQAMLFMSAAQGLSEELNIIGVFTESLMTRLEDNMNNKDSIMEIVANTYMETDFYLQENNRSVLAKAILAGAWLEGLYVATELNTPADRQDFVWKRIGEQKKGLTNLINMLDDCKEPQLTELLTDLRKLETTFSGVKIQQETLSNDSAKSIAPVISKVIISANVKKAIKEETKACRNKIVSGK